MPLPVVDEEGFLKWTWGWGGVWGRVGGGTRDDGLGDVITGEWAKRPSETLNESQGAWCGARS